MMCLTTDMCMKYRVLPGPLTKAFKLSCKSKPHV